MVYECRQAVKIPIIGMGGIADAQRRARVHDRRRRRPCRSAPRTSSIRSSGRSSSTASATTWPATASRGSPTWSGTATSRRRTPETTHEPDPGRARRRHDRRRRWRWRTTAPRLTSADFKIGNQLFTAEGPALVRALAARGRPRVPRPRSSTTSRTPCAGAVRAAARAWRVDGQRPRERRADDDAGGPAGRRSDARRTRASDRWSSRSPCSPSIDQATLDVGSASTAPIARCRVEAPGGPGAGRRTRTAWSASPHEIGVIRARAARRFLDRHAGHPQRGRSIAGDDQARTLSAAEAMAAGASYLVIGRPILSARIRRRQPEDTRR